MPGTLPPLPPHNPSAVPGNVCSEFFETVSRDERRVCSNFVRDLWREWGFLAKSGLFTFTFLEAAKLPCVLIAVYL